jgi:hypothetical protein
MREWQPCRFQLERLLAAEMPALAQHLQELGITPTMYASKWLLTLFACSLPLDVACRIADAVWLDGFPAAFAAALTILSDHEDHLLRQGLDGVMLFFSRASLCARYAGDGGGAKMVAGMQRCTVTPKRLAALAVEHTAQVLREQQQASETARLVAEVARLAQDNAALAARVASLERESQLFASRMLQQSVQLHERTEELFELKVRFGLAKDDL